jgi:hypothetical protein
MPTVRGNGAEHVETTDRRKGNDERAASEALSRCIEEKDDDQDQTQSEGPTQMTKFDYKGIHQLSQELHRPTKTLVALSTNNDPFFLAPGRQANAKWFAALWKRFKLGSGVHIRRVHYLLISQKTAIKMLNGMPYRNTLECSSMLSDATRDARYLGLVPADDFVDRRNEEPIINLREDTGDPNLYIRDSLIPPPDKHMPPLPTAALDVPQRPQPYQIEIWAEKSTMNDILEPISKRYGVTLITSVGEISTTHCNLCAERAKQDGRPVRILYISDFDPAGLSMPVAAARKIEFFVRESGDDLDMQLHPLVLTPKQCEQYELPRTPIKHGEARAAAFEHRFGEGATELDALEALHPGELARIIERAITRYYDDALDNETEAMAKPIHPRLKRVTTEVHEQHRKNIDSLRKEYKKITDALARWNKRAKPTWHAIQKSIDAKASTIVDTVEWPEARSAREQSDPLYDSSREYVEQINRYKKFQDKPITRAPHGSVIARMDRWHLRRGTKRTPPVRKPKGS